MIAPFLYRLPDFIIPGAQKGGTTSLFHDLCAHPQVIGARLKEVHYFDNHYDRPRSWYRRQFPSHARLALRALRHGRRVLTGEATPMYLIHPHAAGRIAALLPSVRLILLLRDPAERAYSQYQHNRRMGWEPLSFEEAIDREEERTAPALRAMLDDPLCVDTRFHAWSYKARGRYLEQLQRFERHFAREQMLVLFSEELFAEPARAYTQVLRFLGLEDFTPARFTVANPGNYAAQRPPKVDELRRYFTPFNEELAAHLGHRPPWT